ncbi:hypothetical protein J1605_018600 [Eschrichtius robustus]|uniref:Cadherin domain-containing protein n=1 Tax=Eschrichtius robustus TaxID=9764 RepID=A0AB34HV75_ESCRO|nr:hypothetical protein J1605_018600 [Eschrichtius robustus]
MRRICICLEADGLDIRGNVDGKFSVGYRDAVVRTVVNLDRETTASYTLVLEAIDNGPVGKRRTGTATVFVTVLDVNDNRPIFLQSSYEASVPEDIPEGHSISSPIPHCTQKSLSEQGEAGDVTFSQKGVEEREPGPSEAQNRAAFTGLLAEAPLLGNKWAQKERAPLPGEQERQLWASREEGEDLERRLGALPSPPWRPQLLRGEGGRA